MILFIFSLTSINNSQNQTITVSDLDKVAAWQGLSGNWSTPGDVLCVRTGWVRAYNNLSVHDQEVLPYGPGGSIGIKAGDEAAEWLWNKKLAIVGADNPAFESLPLGDATFGDDIPRSFHQIFIGGKHHDHYIDLN